MTLVRLQTVLPGILLLCLLLPASGRTEASAQQMHQHGIASYRSGDVEQALSDLRKAHQLDPYNASITRNLSVALLNRGRQLMQQGQYQDAEELFYQGRQLAPENIDFWIDRGHALLALRNYAEAEVDLNEALGMDPEQAVAWQFLGRLYYLTSRLSEAIEAWQEALELDPGNARLREVLAKAHREIQIETKMTRSYAANFVISYDDDNHPDLGDALLEVLNQAYTDVGGDLDYYPSAQVPVLVYTRKDFSRVTLSPGWAAGAYDGKIRVPVGGVSRVSAPLKGVLFHEYAHVAVRDLTGGNCPTWLNEGLAEQVGRTQFDPPLKVLDTAETLLGFSGLSRSWKNLPAEHVRLAYEQSYSFVHFLIDDYGWYLIGDVLRNLARRMDVAAAFEAAYRSYGLDLKSLQQQWKERLGRA